MFKYVIDFQGLIDSGNIEVIQPDARKWAEVTGCVAVAGKAIAASRRYCPHYLGGGIGLIASAHILAAVGGDGLTEISSCRKPPVLALTRT